MKKNNLKMMPLVVDGQHVWVVYCGMNVVAYAWPRDGKGSMEIAQEIIDRKSK
jgi:hypothetical protein